MSKDLKCERCDHPVPAHLDRCPHCWVSLTAPNVRAAFAPTEREALAARYQSVVANVPAAAREPLAAFEAAVAERSRAVLARSVTDVLNLAAGDKNVYDSFYELVRKGVRMPSNGHWDGVREAVDSRLFPYYKEHVRFANLSLDGLGLEHYGDCFLVLKDEMIGERATVFEANSIVFVDRIGMKLTGELPAGHRASWGERGRLAVAKLGATISSETTEADFPGLLLRNAANAEDDEFIEVHIYGSFSIHAVAAVRVKGKAGGARMHALRKRLKDFDIPVMAA